MRLNCSTNRVNRVRFRRIKIYDRFCIWTTSAGTLQFNTGIFSFTESPCCIHAYTVNTSSAACNVWYFPNITGRFKIAGAGNKECFECFAQGEQYTALPYGGQTGTTPAFDFDANLSNSIYANSDTVQPPSNQTLIIIKT